MTPYQTWVAAAEPGTRNQHYVALLLFPDQSIAVQDLGEASIIEEQVRSLRSALTRPSSNPTTAARALHDQVLLPLLRFVGKKSELFLSLDGGLHLIPFDALHDGRDYLLGRYHFHYITSGRDLLRPPSRQPAQPALLLANPDFGRVDPRTQDSGKKSLYQRLASLGPLPGTEREARALQVLLGVEPVLTTAATEEVVRGTRAPWVLHIATHGLFLQDEDVPMPDQAATVRRESSPQTSRRLEPLASPQAVATEPLVLPGGTGLLSRSALVLAGAVRGQQALSSAHDGLLTAEEARSLDLDGTQLVVLSSCESGKGALSVGQGVYGLRRAFLVAGAETLITSLWQVDDAATGELMTMYYRNLLGLKRPGDRLGSMISAMEQMRRNAGRAHPYYWAPFLVVGQDGPLRARPGNDPTPAR